MRATNASGMKNRNQKLILDLIRKHNLSRADLAKETGLTRAALSIIVEELIATGVVEERVGRTNRVGRNPARLFLRGESGYFAGVDINRTGFTFGIINLTGELITYKNHPRCTVEEFMAKLPAIFHESLRRMRISPEAILSFGITAPGPVDVKKRIILNPPNFSDWHDVPIADMLEQALGYTTYLENVSHSCALAEKYFGVMADVDNFVSLWFDSGVAAGIVMDGNLFGGNTEIGHTTIQPDGLPCECGSRGCLEKYASIQSILAETGYTTWREASAHPEVLEKEAAYLSVAIGNLFNIFNLEAVVLPRNLVNTAKPLLPLLQDKMEPRILSRELPAVLESGLTSWVQLATAVPMYHYFN